MTSKDSISFLNLFLSFS